MPEPVMYCPVYEPTLPIDSQAEAVFTPEGLCDWIGLSFDTYQKMRRQKKGPKEIRVGKNIRILKSDAIDWLKTMRIDA